MTKTEKHLIITIAVMMQAILIEKGYNSVAQMISNLADKVNKEAEANDTKQ